jgi:hypothetical protein
MSKLARDRGANYEREVATAVFDTLGIKIKRNLQQYQTAELGDLELGPFLLSASADARSQSTNGWSRPTKHVTQITFPLLFLGGTARSRWLCSTLKTH